MTTRTVQYFFGRLNLIAVFDNKREFLLTGLRGKSIIHIRNSGWGFFEINEIEDRGDNWLYGYLVKYRPETDEEKVVTETHTIEDEIVQDRVKAKARFFVHIESGVIAYRTISNHISRGQFVNNFVAVFQENHENFFVQAEIQSIEEELPMLETLQRFTRIQEVRIVLHPSNPNNRDIWDRTDRRIKDLNAVKYQEQLEANRHSDGLYVTQDEEIKGKITMAVDGYGLAEVTGTLDGNNKTVRTNDNPITRQAPNDDAPVEDIFQSILLAFRIIKERFQNKSRSDVEQDG
jgi:hypothetical protein